MSNRRWKNILKKPRPTPASELRQGDLISWMGQPGLYRIFMLHAGESPGQSVVWVRAETLTQWPLVTSLQVQPTKVFSLWHRTRTGKKWRA